MLHLLPESHKKKIISEYKRRFFIVFLLGIVSIVVISAVFAIPSYIISFARYSDISYQKDIVDKEFAGIQKEDSSKDVKEILDMVSVIKNNASDIIPTGAIEQILSKTNAGITIKNISYTPSDDTSVVVDISGRSDTRQNLADFVETLQKTENFSGVELPVSSFARDRDINFSLKIMISYLKQNE
jgi:hypothetical protein